MITKREKARSPPQKDYTAAYERGISNRKRTALYDTSRKKFIQQTGKKLGTSKLNMHLDLFNATGVDKKELFQEPEEVFEEHFPRMVLDYNPKKDWPKALGGLTPNEDTLDYDRNRQTSRRGSKKRRSPIVSQRSNINQTVDVKLFELKEKYMVDTMHSPHQDGKKVGPNYSPQRDYIKKGQFGIVD